MLFFQFPRNKQQTGDLTSTNVLQIRNSRAKGAASYASDKRFVLTH